jgi:hypothetical protein
VWQRFKEAPKLYPGVAQLLRDAATDSFGWGSILSVRCATTTRPSRSCARISRRSRNKPHAAALAKVLALESEHGKST